MKFVIVESPYRGEVHRNLQFARACVKDAIDRGELPFASHLLYTQSGILNDGIPEERQLGVQLNLMMLERADLVAVYWNLGITQGMRTAIEHASRRHVEVEFRLLTNFPHESSPSN